MSGYFSEARSAETVIDRIGTGADPRLRRIMASLIAHLHGFIKDVALTEAEWEQAIGFLTETGRMCSGTRQEFILLSDVLGASMLVDAINHRTPAPATQSTVFGPFHVDGAPVRQMGESISLDGKGEPCLFHGRVLDTDGDPVAGASVDVWSDNADGFYDVQQPDIQPPFNNRGVFLTEEDGRYAFRGVKPVSYPIPSDGPVGRMLEALGRHPWRPAHMHFLINAPGFERLITHIFVAGDGYLESDAVFGVKDQLVVDFKPADSPTERWLAEYDFVLVRRTQ